MTSETPSTTVSVPGPATLRMHDATTEVCLGWTKEERRVPQTVTLDICMQRDTPPRACSSDLLEDTICYDVLLQEIRKRCKEKQFKLIESLAAEIAGWIRSLTAGVTSLEVTVGKCPPVDGLPKVSFTYTETTTHA